MNSQPKNFTAMRIVAFTVGAVLLYTLWRGPERFCYESFGTLVVSPEIYTRVLPAPLNHWLLSALINAPVLSYVLYAIPVLMLVFSVVAAVVSIRRNSALHACASLLLAGAVFGTYHFLQPLGMTVKFI